GRFCGTVGRFCDIPAPFRPPHDPRALYRPDRGRRSAVAARAGALAQPRGVPRRQRRERRDSVRPAGDRAAEGAPARHPSPHDVWAGAGAPHHDPLHNLREYRTLAPWNLRDLAALVGAILDASAITPINAAAKAQPSERTIRFYVTKGLVSPPEGRGTAATYSYRHFLQLLWIKLRQMDGATLATITKDMQDQTGDVLE